MARMKLALGLLAISLAAPGVHAQTAPAGTAQSPANAVDPASIQALKDMGALSADIEALPGHRPR